MFTSGCNHKAHQMALLLPVILIHQPCQQGARNCPIGCNTTQVVSATPQWQSNGPLGLAVQESSHSGRESSHHSGNQGNYHHHHCDQDDYDWRLPRNREHGQNLKMTPYDGKVAWWAYEMKLEHMANQYNWGEAEKLNKLVEALQDKALTFYSNLPDNVRENYGLVRRKFNAQFGPKDPSQTVCNQLKVIQQKPEEELEEFATHCHQLATDAWGRYLHGGSRSCCC